MASDPLEDKNLQKIEKQARKRVRELKEFYTHLGIYVVVNVFLAVLSLLTSPGYFWAIWPILGWGIGLFSHAVAVFGLFGIGGSEWEERKVREMMLMQQQGLSASQVRQLLHDELDEAAAGPGDLRRVIERLENLEAIVTSKDWDLVEPSSREGGLLRDDLPGPETKAHEAEAARLARRVR
jgi:hypothetical protein